MQIQIFHDLGSVQFTQDQSNFLYQFRRQPPGIIAFKKPLQPPMLKASQHLFSVLRQVTPVNESINFFVWHFIEYDTEGKFLP